MQEIERQIKMAWQRGHTLGIVFGIIGTVFAFIFIGLIIKFLF